MYATTSYKIKYYLRRTIGIIITPIAIAFQLGRAFERWYMLVSGRYDMRR